MCEAVPNKCIIHPSMNNSDYGTTWLEKEKKKTKTFKVKEPLSLILLAVTGKEPETCVCACAHVYLVFFNHSTGFLTSRSGVGLHFSQLFSFVVNFTV